MSNPLPNAVALTTINDGDQAQAAPLRNNYSAIQSAVNLIRACLAGGSAGQLLQAADGTDVQWVTGVPLSAIYRKTSSKDVVNTVAETDLLNGEITIGAGVLSTNRVLRLTAMGDLVNNTGGALALPRIKLKLGATTIIDSGALAASWSSSSARFSWRAEVVIANLGSANAQWTDFRLLGSISGVGGVQVFTTGEGIGGVVNDIWELLGGNSSTVDTSVAQALALTVTLPTASVSEDIKLNYALAEII